MRQAECRSSRSLAESGGEGALEGANQRCGGEGWRENVKDEERVKVEEGRK